MRSDKMEKHLLAITLLEEQFGRSLQDIGEIKTYQVGERLIKFNQGTDKLFFLLAGKAKIYLLHEDGKQSLIQFLSTGELVGELSLLGIEERTKDVIAQTNCTCLVVPVAIAKAQLLTSNSFLLGLNQYLGKKLLLRTERLTESLNYPLINRLGAFVLFAENQGLYREKHTEVAEYLNVSYRHLLHTFQELRQQELIVKEGTFYRILNKKKLEDIAKAIHS
ncbi:transcriptional regulator YeiL [Vagococcus salmoninarum]|nr:transcriptional regulator YeiL [Vagococcus salmoninarum]